MEVLEAFVLGIVQGVTGLLPVPTDLHLELVRRLGFSRSGPLRPADIDWLRLGSALGILAALRMELVRLLKERPLWIGLLVLSAVPVAVFGPKVAPVRTQGALAPWGALVMAGFLLACQRWGAPAAAVPGRPLPRGEVAASDALLVGLSQVAAFFPGMGRLGLGFGSGLLAGIDRSVALLFAFVALPAALGTELATAAALGRAGPALSFVPLAIGVLGAFSTTLVLFAPATDLLRSRSLVPFAAWSAAAGGLAFLA